MHGAGRGDAQLQGVAESPVASPRDCSVFHEGAGVWAGPRGHSRSTGSGCGRADKRVCSQRQRPRRNVTAQAESTFIYFSIIYDLAYIQK